MRPANAVCEVMHITDEHERGMIRMLVKRMLLGLIAIFGFVVASGTFREHCSPLLNANAPKCREFPEPYCEVDSAAIHQR
jgi:hypothetical protein